MLAKSKRSAFVMASVASLTYFVTNLFVNSATHYGMTSLFHSPQEEVNHLQLSWPPFLVFIIALFIMIGFGGLMIHTVCTSEIHFGVNGVIRWGLFGVVVAALVKLYPSIFSIQSFAIRELIELAIVPIAYVIVFKIFPFWRKEQL